MEPHHLSPPSLLVQSQSQGADREREQAQQRSSTIPMPGLLVRSQSHLAQGTTVDIGFDPLNDSGGIGTSEQEEKKEQEGEDEKLVFMEEERRTDLPEEQEDGEQTQVGRIEQDVELVGVARHHLLVLLNPLHLRLLPILLFFRLISPPPLFHQDQLLILTRLLLFLLRP